MTQQTRNQDRMRRRVLDVRKWDPKRPPNRGLDPSPREPLTATPTEQALERQMADGERRDERRRYRADEWDST